MSADLESLRQLSLAEKLHVVEVLWEDIATSSEDFPVPEWMRSEVEKRLAEHAENPDAAITRDELWKRVEQKRG
jgi:putative addiction module component (TIGR02574 family)